MELITTILNFFTDSTKRLTARAMTFFALLIVLWVIDNTFSFTYYYSLDKKLSYIEKIDKIIADSSTNKLDSTYLLQQKSDIIKHKSAKDKAWEFISSDNYNFFRKKNNQSTENGNIKPIFQFITASFPLIIIMIILPFVAYLDKSLTFAKATITVIIIEIILYSIATIITNTLSLIPIILNRPYINYIANILINIIFFCLTYKIGKKGNNERPA